jgi:hypothetical protein
MYQVQFRNGRAVWSKARLRRAPRVGSIGEGRTVNKGPGVRGNGGTERETNIRPCCDSEVQHLPGEFAIRVRFHFRSSFGCIWRHSSHLVLLHWRKRGIAFRHAELFKYRLDVARLGWTDGSVRAIALDLNAEDGNSGTLIVDLEVGG